MKTTWFLLAVFLLFVGLMVAVWVCSDRAHPVLLDHNGQPTTASTHHH